MQLALPFVNAPIRLESGARQRRYLHADESRWEI